MKSAVAKQPFAGGVTTRMMVGPGEVDDETVAVDLEPGCVPGGVSDD